MKKTWNNTRQRGRCDTSLLSPISYQLEPHIRCSICDASNYRPRYTSTAVLLAECLVDVRACVKQAKEVEDSAAASAAAP